VRLKSLISLLAFSVLAAGSGPALAIGEDDYLPPDQAFKYTATADESQVTVEWQVIQGYYLYQKRMGLSSGTPASRWVTPRNPRAKSTRTITSASRWCFAAPAR